MNPLNIRSDWWVFTDERFVTCYDTKEEAIAHVEYQKKKKNSTVNWYVQHIKMQFEEYQCFPYKFRS